ncbi:MAG: serine/threonine-protein kinase [Planctomycetota bacterium]
MNPCPQCGRDVPDLAKFCNRCGAPQDETLRASGESVHLSIPSHRPLSTLAPLSRSQAFNSLVALDRTESRAQVPAASGALLADRYRIVRVIGRGGLGVVYRAWDEEGDRFVAAKILLPALMKDPSTLQRFEGQVLPLAQLHHERIVPILDAGSTGEIAYLIMPLLPGGTLRNWIQSKRPRRRTQEDLLRIVGWGRQVAEGLAYAHRFIVHRDLKPGNILLDGQGFARIADFDLAKFRRANPLTMTGQSFGTAYYMAPEQIRDPGGVDGRADLFSLGVILYEAVTGALPVGAFRPPSRIVRGCPRALDEIVLTLMAFEPQARVPNAQMVVRGLGRILGFLARRAGLQPEGKVPQGRQTTPFFRSLVEHFLRE